jgi:plasmid maintenance system antidote protein VapI
MTEALLNQTLNQLDVLSQEITDAINRADMQTAMQLDEARLDNIHRINNQTTILSPQVITRLTQVLDSIKSDIVNLENTIETLNKTTSQHMRRLNGYR